MDDPLLNISTMLRNYNVRQYRFVIVFPWKHLNNLINFIFTLHLNSFPIKQALDVITITKEEQISIGILKLNLPHACIFQVFFLPFWLHDCACLYLNVLNRMNLGPAFFTEIISINNGQ